MIETLDEIYFREIHGIIFYNKDNNKLLKILNNKIDLIDKMGNDYLCMILKHSIEVDNYTLFTFFRNKINYNKLSRDFASMLLFNALYKKLFDKNDFYFMIITRLVDISLLKSGAKKTLIRMAIEKKDKNVIKYLNSIKIIKEQME